ncbi:hypothetical protein ACJW31_01G067100 [Castanea mollissima]
MSTGLLMLDSLALKPQQAVNHKTSAIGQLRNRWHVDSSSCLQIVQQVSLILICLDRLSLVGRTLAAILQRNILDLSGILSLHIRFQWFSEGGWGEERSRAV